jgi:hypothetical protein
MIPVACTVQAGSTENYDSNCLLVSERCWRQGSLGGCARHIQTVQVTAVSANVQL